MILEAPRSDGQRHRLHLLGLDVHLQLEAAFEQILQHRPRHRRRVRRTVGYSVDRVALGAHPVRASPDADAILHAEPVHVVHCQAASTATGIDRGRAITVRVADDRRQCHAHRMGASRRHLKAVRPAPRASPQEARECCPGRTA